MTYSILFLRHLIIIVFLHSGWLFALILSLLELLYKFSEWCQFLSIDQIELVNEIYEMLKASVQMRFCWKKHNMLEMGVIDMGIDSEQALENYLDDIDKVLGEGDSKLTGENFLVVKLILNPSHQKINIFCCTNFQGSLDIVSVSPQVFVLRSSRHGGTYLSGAEFS